MAAILDLYSRKVVGWAISKRIDTELCLKALEMALNESIRKPGEETCGLFHKLITRNAAP